MLQMRMPVGVPLHVEEIDWSIAVVIDSQALSSQVHNYNSFQAWYTTKTAFKPGKQQQQHSSLVHNNNSFQAWYTTTAAFKPGTQPQRFSSLVHNNNSFQAW